MAAFLFLFFSFFNLAQALEPNELNQIMSRAYMGKSQDGGIARLCKVKLSSDSLDNLLIQLEYNSLFQIKVSGEAGYGVLKNLLAPPIGTTETLFLYDSKQSINSELTIQTGQVDNITFIGINRLVLKQKDRIIHTCEYMTAQ